VFASILNSGTNGINIPFNSFAATDVRKTVRLRNLNLNGIATGLLGIRITGGSVITGGTVVIEDCLIDGNFAGSASGLFDERTAGGQLFISNTIVRNTGFNGILIFPGAGSVAGARIDAAFDNLRLENVRVGVGAVNNVRLTINRSVIAGNSLAGIVVTGTLAQTEVNASNNVISSNATGVLNTGGTVTIRLANNDITLNDTAISGATQSYGNNRLQGNTAAGTAPTPISQQ
jgi:hypothetical protein